MLFTGANEGGVAVKRVKLFGASDEVRQRELFFQLVAAVDKFTGFRPKIWTLTAKGDNRESTTSQNMYY